MAQQTNGNGNGLGAQQQQRRPDYVDAHGAHYIVNAGGILHQVTAAHFAIALEEQLVRPATAHEIERYWRRQGYVYNVASGTYSRQGRLSLLRLPGGEDTDGAA